MADFASHRTQRAGRRWYTRGEAWQRVLRRSAFNERGCLVHYGTRMASGHTQTSRDGMHVLAHVAVYEAVYEPVPLGCVVHHVCENKACVNPTHLRMLSASEHGRLHQAHKVAQTHCIHGHEFTLDNTCLRPDGRRKCKCCNTLAERERKARQQETTT